MELAFGIWNTVAFTCQEQMLSKSTYRIIHMGHLQISLTCSDTSPDKVYFIDYEYASYNYRGYDIGNHFAEYAGFECDYSL